MRWFSRLYGSNPLHLLVTIACFAIAGYAANKLAAGGDVKGILIWLVGAVVGHDLILFPLYALADRSIMTVFRRRPPAMPAVPWINYLRVPAVFSAILLLIWFPLIFRLPKQFQADHTTLPINVYMGRWLAVTGALFLLSAVAFAVRLAVPRGKQEGYEEDGADQHESPRLSSYEQHPPRYGQRPSGQQPRLPGYEQYPSHYEQGPSQYERGPSGQQPSLPGYEQGPPRYGQRLSGQQPRLPGYEQYPSHYEQGPSQYERGPSGQQPSLPGYEQYPSGYEQGPSRYEQGPSRYGRGPSGQQPRLDGYEQDPSGYEQGPSQYEQRLSGQQPRLPEYEQRPSGYEQYPPWDEPRPPEGETGQGRHRVRRPDDFQ